MLDTSGPDCFFAAGALAAGAFAAGLAAAFAAGFAVAAGFFAAGFAGAFVGAFAIEFIPSDAMHLSNCRFSKLRNNR